MDALTFIVEMTKALAWPASIIFIIFLLRKPIIELLPFLEELKYKDFALKFHKEVSKVSKGKGTDRLFMGSHRGKASFFM